MIENPLLLESRQPIIFLPSEYVDVEGVPLLFNLPFTKKNKKEKNHKIRQKTQHVTMLGLLFLD